MTHADFRTSFVLSGEVTPSQLVCFPSEKGSAPYRLLFRTDLVCRNASRKSQMSSPSLKPGGKFTRVQLFKANDVIS